MFSSGSVSRYGIIDGKPVRLVEVCSGCGKKPLAPHWDQCIGCGKTGFEVPRKWVPAEEVK